MDRICKGNWDCPESLHTDQLVRDVRILKSGTGSIVVPHYDFSVSRRDVGKSRRVDLAEMASGDQQLVIIVEGLMIFHDAALRALCDIRVFIDCDEDTRFMRRLARDTDPNGVGGRGRSAASVYRAWSNVVKPAHHRYVEPTKRFAHLVVPSHKVLHCPLSLSLSLSLSVCLTQLTPNVPSYR